jgi:hypothetical protein
MYTCEHYSAWGVMNLAIENLAIETMIIHYVYVQQQIRMMLGGTGPFLLT